MQPMRYQYEDEHRDRLCEWMRANGFDPKSVPINPVVSIANGTITTEVYAKDENGRLVLDPSTHRPLRGIESHPVVVEPDEIVRTWLRPACPACGR